MVLIRVIPINVIPTNPKGARGSIMLEFATLQPSAGSLYAHPVDAWYWAWLPSTHKKLVQNILLYWQCFSTDSIHTVCVYVCAVEQQWAQATLDIFKP